MNDSHVRHSSSVITHGSLETQALGESWGRLAAAGWLIGLSGDLGAGKTQFVKGIARGLGIRATVHSPTFALVNEYGGGRLPLFHLDFYRLETPQQILRAGLHEYLLRDDGVVVVEWIERWTGAGAALAPPGDISEKVARPGETWAMEKQRRGTGRPYRSVRLETLSETDRRITYEDFGN